MLHKRDQTNPDNWKHDIISSLKSSSDYLIEVGTETNPTESSDSNSF